MLKNIIKHLVIFIATFISSLSAIATVSQSPLLNQPQTVAPNMVLILDDSGSMDGDYIYQYGNIDSSGMGRLGPESYEYKWICNNYNSSGNCKYSYSYYWWWLTYYNYSPDINRIYYDPRIRYKPRVDYLGSNLPIDAATTSTWEVYFRKTTGAYTTGQLGSESDYYTSSDNLPSDRFPVVTGSPVKYLTHIEPSTLSSAFKFPKFINRSDCTNLTWCTVLEERQNYSNWAKWYSTRAKMTVTSLSASFQTIPQNSIRLGYGTLATLYSNANSLVKGVSSYNTSTKQNFYTWMQGVTFNGATPNLEAVDDVGQYFSRTDSDGPWGTTPNANSNTVAQPSVTTSGESIANHVSCRRSYSMLVTDGYWNDTTYRPTSAQKADNTAFTQTRSSGGNFTYTPVYPYKDSYSNTLADIAMRYWAKDLRPDLANRVPTISVNGIDNPSFWQNVSFYAITLGLDGTLNRSTPTLEASTLTSLKSGVTLWPNPVQSTPSTIDDTWHATINGRGDLLNAGNSVELTAGLNNMFSAISGTPQTLSGVAVSATYLKSGTRKYKPEYVSGTWSGRLSAIELDSITGNDKVPTNIFWQVEKGVDSKGDPITTIPPFASRNIVTWNGSSSVDFISSNASSWTLISSENRLSADELNYIRGDFSKESRYSVGTYRNRDSRLGDIVNSSPVYIKDNLNMGYDKTTITGKSTYLAYIANKTSRPDGVLIVGANDGMLHAFKNSDGAETFAYIPQAVRPKLIELTKANYSHQYYVDGPNVEADAYLNGSWKNMVLGSTGAGAKAVYALDIAVANPNPSITTAISVKWEVNSNTTNFSELGHVTGDVQAGKIKNGPWVAIFGNGFDSTSGSASLFVVNLEDGVLLKKIVADSGSGNGLGGVRVVRDSNKEIIGAYAGDLKGNLWKFDISGSATNKWKVDLGTTALYAAKDASGNSQPITAAPTVIDHPSGGYVVSFGTGKFVDAADTVSSNFLTQSIYGIWDKQDFGKTPVSSGATFVGRSPKLADGVTSKFLQEQTITTVPVTNVVNGQSITTNYFNVSANSVAWGDGLASGKRGWFIDLLPSTSGQRVTYPLERLTGTFVMATTISYVSAATPDVCTVSGSGTGWAYIIDGLTGGGPTKQVIDTNSDGAVNESDALVSGWKDVVDGRPTAITIGSTSKAESYCIVTGQSTCIKSQIACGQTGANACAPAALSGLKTREWRQLFMR